MQKSVDGAAEVVSYLQCRNQSEDTESSSVLLAIENSPQFHDGRQITNHPMAIPVGLGN